MHCAYLVNIYPRVSHSFIRREIRALEQLGWRVDRFSVRAPDTPLPDPDDRDEQDRTRVILGAGLIRILAAVACVATRAPAAFARALCCAWRLGGVAGQSRLRHLVYLAEACVLRRWLRRSGAQHLHVHFGTNSTTVALLCRRLGGPTYSFTVHGPEEFDRPESLSLPEKIASASAVIAVSHFGRSQLCRWAGPEHWSRLRVVRCGVDSAFMGREPSAPPEAPRLICVGRLCEAKGQLLLLQACRVLADSGQPFELVLVGDGAYRPHVERMVAALGLSGHVRLTGWLSNQRVREEIVAARAMVLPSFAEGLPVVLMEALALGRPVISTYIAGIPELVAPGVNGWLVPAGSVDALVDAMRDALAASPYELLAMGCNGARKVSELHDAAREAVKLASALERMPQTDRQPGGSAPIVGVPWLEGATS